MNPQRFFRAGNQVSRPTARGREVPRYDQSLFRSERFLESESFHRGAWGLFIAVVLLGLWLAWFFRSRVTVYAVSDTADVEVDRAAHPVESQYAGRVVASTLALDREVESGDVLVELDADVQKLQLSEERTRLAGLGPQINSLADQIAAEQRASEQHQHTSSVAHRLLLPLTRCGLLPLVQCMQIGQP